MYKKEVVLNDLIWLIYHKTNQPTNQPRFIRVDFHKLNPPPRETPSLLRKQYITKIKLATIVEGDPKAPFSIATTPRCREGRYSFPRIAPLYP